MRWGREEALAVTDLDNIRVADLPVRLTRYDLEKIPVRSDRRGRNMTQLLPGHFKLVDFVVCPVNLDSEIQLRVVP